MLRDTLASAPATCWALGAAEQVPEHRPPGYPRVVVLCAVETTAEPTRLLFEASARATGAELEVRMVPGAWDAFRAGDRDGYLTRIARAADETGEAPTARVALAQASMAGACNLILHKPPAPVGLEPPTVG